MHPSKKSSIHISISKKFAKANVRNKFKRQIKTAIKDLNINKIKTKNQKIIIKLKKEAISIKYQDLYRDLSNITSKINF